MAPLGHPRRCETTYNSGSRYHFIRGEATLRRSFVITVIAVALLAAVAAPVALAHSTKAVGSEGQFLISFGFNREPIYTNDLNGLQFIVRRAADGEPVAHLEHSLLAEIIAPDGVSRRQVTLRGVWGEPGEYTADLVLTQPGIYDVRLWGFIDDLEFEETFHSHEVTELDDIKFP